MGSLVASELKFAVVIARFNDLVTKLLLEGALEAFDRHGGDRDSVDVSAAMCHDLLSIQCCYAEYCKSTMHDKHLTSLPCAVK